MRRTASSSVTGKGGRRMLTREEYKKIVTRIFDKIRGDHEEHKRDSCCSGIAYCSKCPFDGSDIFCLSGKSIDYIFNAFEYAERWAKEHPFITNEQKYEETFGVKPLQIDKCTKNYLCPKHAGFDIGINCNAQSCEECKEDFWQSEYKEPKKEG